MLSKVLRESRDSIHFHLHTIQTPLVFKEGALLGLENGKFTINTASSTTRDEPTSPEESVMSHPAS